MLIMFGLETLSCLEWNFQKAFADTYVKSVLNGLLLNWGTSYYASTECQKDKKDELFVQV